MSDIYVGKFPKPIDDALLCVEAAVTPVVMGFWGNCHAVRLVYRGQKDNHICFEILTEDDGNWFVSKNCTSSFWLPELINILSAADNWMKENAKPDMNGNIQFGYLA